MPLSDLLSLKVLVVDDDETSIEFIKAVLHSHGFNRVDGLTDPTGVLEYLHTERPDLILLDVIMPNSNGFDVLREIRASLAPDEYLPVAMITGSDKRTVQAHALAEGAADFLPKPLDEGEVVLRVCNLLRARWQHLQLQIRNAHLDHEIRSQRLLASELATTSARLSALLSNLQSGILVEDENRKIVLVNPRLCELFLIPAPHETLIGVDCAQAVDQSKYFFANPERFVERVEQILRDRVIVTDEELETADGRTFERNYVPIFQEDKYLGHLWNYRDISDRKRAQLELAEARDTALQSARLKADFLANMSHEIRTPINGVLGMLGLLADSPLKTEQRSLVKTAQTSADALLDIINDVLDFSKIEAGKLLIEDGVFSPVGVLDDCLQTVSAIAYDRGLELTSHIEPDVPFGARGDGARVRQVLTNFLSNALKFTTRGEIAARVRIEREFLHFAVSDTGIGLSRETISQLFRPFTQADSSTTRRYGGTGLGLAISRHLVEEMGGCIGVDSVEGQGATFWFTLPLTPVELEDDGQMRDSIIALCDARVLVVEDNATIRRYLLQQLDSWHIAGEGARTGAEALHRLRSAARAGRPYDGVLLDAQLPDTDAITLAQKIKGERALARTHLILMTALTSHMGTAEPFVANLAKPVRQSQLHDALLQAFQGSTPSRVRDLDSPENSLVRFDGATVLVADDNFINREVAWRWLKKWGCEVVCVTNGREALETLQQQKFDVVLMDCQMPEIDGYAASRRIRLFDDEVRSIPIIAVTAHAMEGDAQKCLEAGMDDYVAKPIRPDKLAEVMARWVTPTTHLGEGQPCTGHVTPVPRIETSPEKVLDMGTLLELRSLVEDEEFATFIEVFYEQVREYERLMRNAVENDDALALSRVAHSLKGVSNQFGARGVVDACQCLEDLIKGTNDQEMVPSTKSETIGTVMEDIRSALASARLALHRATASLGSEALSDEQVSS